MSPYQASRSIYHELFVVTSYYKTEISKIMRNASRDFGLKGVAQFSHFQILCDLYYGDAKTLTELSDASGMSRPNVTSSIKSLVKLGLVKRTDDPNDRRKVLVSLTDQGKQFCEHILHASDRVHSVIYGNSEQSVELIDCLNTMLSRISSSLDSHSRRRILCAMSE